MPLSGSSLTHKVVCCWLRKRPTLFRENPVEVYYDDYRDLGSGVKIPFYIYDSGLPAFGNVDQFNNADSKVRDNVPLDSGKFATPQSKTPTIPWQ
jgi:hypothetical protein